MSDRIVRQLELLAVPLVGIVVTIHLWWGIQRFVRRYLMAGVVIDPRPIVFVLTSFLLLAGVALAYLGGPRRPLYVGGIALMFTYISGYFWWHLAGHQAALPWVDGGDHGHGEVTLASFIVDHAREDTMAMVSKGAEALLALVLGLLLYVDLQPDDTAQTVAIDE